MNPEISKAPEGWTVTTTNSKGLKTRITGIESEAIALDIAKEIQETKKETL